MTSNIPEGLVYTARHLIQRTLSPRLLSQAAFGDVASNFRQALPGNRLAPIRANTPTTPPFYVTPPTTSTIITNTHPVPTPDTTTGPPEPRRARPGPHEARVAGKHARYILADRFALVCKAFDRVAAL